ncbi:MAG: EAL domain-containing protein [Burkholderiales bacterium]|nr:EAL domain-containing protein [Burkholderiales bacterium]
MSQKTNGHATVLQELKRSPFAKFLLLASLYFIVAKLSLTVAIPPGIATPIWPPAAVALCASLAWGMRIAPAIWVGAVLANMTAGVSLLTASMIGLGNMGEAVAATLLIQRLIGGAPYFSRSENAVKFAVVATVSTLIAATIGTGALALHGYIGAADIGRNWLTWWLGDATAIVILSPLLLMGQKQFQWPFHFFRRLEMVIFIAMLAGVTHLVFSTALESWAGPYMTLLLIMWAGFRFGTAGVARTVVFIAAIAVWDTLMGRGPFGKQNVDESLLLLQVFLSIIGVAGIALAAALEQRKQSEDMLREDRNMLERRVIARTAALNQELDEIRRLEQVVLKREYQLAESQRLAHLGSWQWEIASDVVIWSDELFRIFGVDMDKFRGTFEQYLERIHPDDRAMAQNTIQHAIQSHAPYSFVHRVVTSSGAEKTVICRGSVVLDESGSAVRMYGTAQDVTEQAATEAMLRDAEKRFRNVVEQAPDAMVIVNREGEIVLMNAQTESLFGYSRQELLGKKIEILMPMRFREKHAAYRENYFLKPSARRMGTGLELYGQHASGKEFPVEICLSPLETKEGILASSAIRDVSERKQAEQSLRLAAKVFESSREGILIADQNRLIISVNKACIDITGYSAEEVIGDSMSSLRSELLGGESYDRIWTQINETGHWEGEVLRRKRNGQPYVAWVSVTAVQSASGITNYIAVFSDITERKEAESRIQFMAEHDFLTRLPSRTLLLDRLEQGIASAMRNGAQLAVLFIDLDRFKNVNDSLGHNIGDKLLQEVAQRLQKCVRSVDTVSRQGGDEFVIVLVDIGSTRQVAHVIRNLMDAITKPFQINGYEIIITASIGISMYPSDGTDIDTLIKNADVAMYHAKERGRNDFQFFGNEMNTRIAERLALENSLRKAIERKEFVLHYQPQMECTSRRTVGAEALIRWEHPDIGLLMPSRFIAVAEESGLIDSIGEWVLRSACLQAKTWMDKAYPLIVSVNVSVAQFRKKDLVQIVSDALKFADLPPGYLELEITESILADDVQDALDTLRSLRNIGVRLAIDDFGTGYSSLSYLKRLTIDKLKIDQSFVHDITTDQNDAEITSAIIAMAKNLRVKVIAEGVETKEQLQFLESRGCDEFQGYYLSEALAATDFSKFEFKHAPYCQ